MTDAIRFVRDRELACYRGWGVDYWRPKNGSAPLGGDVNGAPSGSGGLPGHRGPNRTLVGMPIIQLIPVDATSDEPIDYVHSIEWNDDAGSVS
jgi:hypothetical protein